MSSIASTAPKRGFPETSRRDRWWQKPLAVFIGLSAFVVYSTWAAFQGDHYRVPGTGYLSPFYSPELFGGEHSWFGPKPGWYPAFLPWSPAFLILWAPAGFRLTCYYYRGAYYKAFWADPPACSVSEPRKTYRGENSLPLILQNLHRYLLYVALVFIVILALDVWHALWFADGRGGVVFGIGLGTLVLLVNVILLGGYTLGCHSFRHLVGGGLDRFSGRPVRQKTLRCVTCLNGKHQLWAWASLVWVGFTDVYVRLCSTGAFTDWRIL